jgi:antitoxin component YwqK of YwqJK toxin-antitoxin module
MALRRSLPCVLALLLAGCMSSGSQPVAHPRRVPADYTGPYTTWWSDERVREEGNYKEGRRDGHVKGYYPDGSLAFEGEFRDGAPVGKQVQNAPGGARAIMPQEAEAAPAAAPSTEAPVVKLSVSPPAAPDAGPAPAPAPAAEPAPKPVVPPEDKEPAPQPAASSGTPATTPPATTAPARSTDPGAARAATPAAAAAAAPRPADGEHLEYFPGGAKRTRSNLRNGALDGEAEQWYESGQLASRGQYELGVPAGEWQAWDEQGHLTSRTVYWTVNGKPGGYLETVQDAEGRVSVQTRMLIDGDNYVSRVTTWYPNGRQAGLVEYHNGQREGRDVSWDTEGHKRSEGRRAADLREGVWTTWDEHGTVESRTLFEHDRSLGSPPAGS